MQVRFRLLHEGAILPRRGHDSDVGLDVFTPTSGTLRPGANKIPLGIACDVPDGWCAAIWPRSGMVSGEASKGMIVVNKDVSNTLYPNGIPILAQMPPIDPGYTGEINVMVVNCSDRAILYEKHTRFGQLVFVPCAYVVPVLNIDRSRGTKGFGSTGITD